ncbi:MAG TPA: [LysW]-aminoadipate kinase [Candidatus Thermoplasmatota archaeon]|jgi:acetylglutamate/LysW-gamma-L-alpha-aminoadipate kinase|nr:[LysW]-aminoadipate kinase [Candidatus Thermoplasmatota archaeon]
MIVVKLGGGAGIDPANTLADLAPRKDWVLVHGASDEASRLGEALGHAPRFVTSISGHVSRFTDERTRDLFAMASGSLNLRLVADLQRRGCNALGLLGPSGRVLAAQRKDHVKAMVEGKRVVLRGDFTGTIDRVNADLLRLLLGQGYAPVLGVPAMSHEGDAVNADADRAAAQVAGALGAEALVILSNVPGLLRDLKDPSSLVRRIPAPELEGIAEKYAQGRFKKKVMGAAEALALGVPRVILASAQVPRPLEAALQGEGTIIHRADAPALPGGAA